MIFPRGSSMKFDSQCLFHPSNRAGLVRMDFRRQNKNKMIRRLVFASLFIHTTLAQQTPAPASTQKWSTLKGNQPLVVARGGLSGIAPECADGAIQMAKSSGLTDLVIMCSLQMSKDGTGFCLTDLRLDNSTTIAMFDPKGQKTCNVNGKKLTAWFMVDYTAQTLFDNVQLIQNIFSRPSVYDGQFPIAGIDELLKTKSPKSWLNVQYAAFYNQHAIKMLDYVLDTVKLYPVHFISSPEIQFLKSLNGKVNASTKVIFQLLDADDVETTTKQLFGTIVKDLAVIKSFAAGIMVPKNYIWPVKPDKYLGPPTTLVADAHKQGLEVYASGFANDFFTNYNYSYDPAVEYLQFIEHGPALIITNNGASGVYPGCTDLAYQQAINDGADIIDCSVQMTKDGVAFCLDAADLTLDTTALSKFTSRTSTVPEVQPKAGIFSFDLAWSEIQSLKPKMVSPYEGFPRNPANKNSGKFVTLPEFLELAKAKAVTGVLINIQNAAYLASNKGLDIVGAVSSALSNATFDKQSTQVVMIQSEDSSVLSKFKDNPSYKRVLLILEKIGDAPKQPVEEITKYAHAVNIPKSSVIEVSKFFTSGMTNVVKEMKDANLSVFVRVMKNEHVSLAFDYFADPYMEIATFVQTAKVDGIVTAFPATASRFMRSPCSNPNPTANAYSIFPAPPGDLVSTLFPEVRPPAEAPSPPLEVTDVVDPPLPSVDVAKADLHQAAANGPATATAQTPSAAWTKDANLGLLPLVAILAFGGLTAGAGHYVI